MGDRQHRGGHFPACSFYRGILSGSAPSGSALVLPTAHCSSETDLGDVSSYTWGADPAPDRAVTTADQRGGPIQRPVQVLVTTTAITPPCQGDNGQHTLRKDVAGIHTKNSPHTKNMRLTEATQRHSHIKKALQDHSR